MRTGLENVSDKALQLLVGNLKSGALSVVEMGRDALISHGPKECPPAAAFELNMTLLQTFEAEFLRRGFNFDAIVGPEFREMIDMWLEARE